MGGKALKKAVPIVKKVDAKASMLAEINGGAGTARLKHVVKEVIDGKKQEEAEKEKAAAAAAGGGGMMAGVHAILERRKFLEAESSSDVSSDGDWD